jgi:hypothetical protein
MEPLGRSSLIVQQYPFPAGSLKEDTRDGDYELRLLYYVAKLVNYYLSGFAKCDELSKDVTKLAADGQYLFQGVITGSIYVLYVLWGTGVFPEALIGKSVLVRDIYGYSWKKVISATQTVNGLAGLKTKPLKGSKAKPIFVIPL